jgi:ribosomal protein S18 acetylase RimI-like enzyme
MSMKHESTFFVRSALDTDYLAFVRLFPELQVDDPVPSLETWTAGFVPSTLVATRGEEVVGYCYFQELRETGYVRNIVVAPAARRLGVGRTLMNATANQLRAHGKSSWRLNVKPDNFPARFLYERMGLRPQYESKSFRMPWVALNALPPGTSFVREPTLERDGELESAFELPRGQLESARGLKRILLEAVSSTTQRSIGLAVFDPKFPGAFPFRVKDIEAVATLLAAMRQLVPADEHVGLVAEDDERLVDLLVGLGAICRDQILHMAGPL